LDCVTKEKHEKPQFYETQNTDILTATVDLLTPPPPPFQMLLAS